MARDSDIVVNGQPMPFWGDPHTTLLDFLRGRGLTGSKEGCAEGECGACAVALVREGDDGTAAYEPINSCLVLAASIVGQEVVTVEGIADGDGLHPVQQLLVEHGGSQCGYCTPGFVMSLFAEYYRSGRDGYDPEAISGNLCRCTGYRPIRDAAQALGSPDAGDRFVARLAQPAPERASFEHAAGPRHFSRPTSLPELFDVLDRVPTAKLVAGGTDVVVEINQRDARFEHIVSLDAVPELRGFELGDDALVIGAASPLSHVEAQARGLVPMLEQLLPLFSSRLIRNRATLGGNIVNASPIGDGPPALLALDAELVLASRGGERVVPLEGFFTGYRETALAPLEIVHSVRIPRPFPTHQRFYKVSKRELDDISTVAAAFALDLEGDVVSRARFAFGGVAATPARAHAAEQALSGRPLDRDAVRDARAALSTAFTPIDDHRGSAAYRSAMVVALFDKLCAELSVEVSR